MHFPRSPSARDACATLAALCTNCTVSTSERAAVARGVTHFKRARARVLACNVLPRRPVAPLEHFVRKQSVESLIAPTQSFGRDLSLMDGEHP
jgi:hypothetical protein